MFRIYYAGKRSVPQVNESNTERTDFGHLIVDMQMGWDFYSEHRDVRDFDLEKTHTLVGVSHLANAEDVFFGHQGENCPRTFCEFINHSDATHTSMSVGDVLVDCDSGKVLFVDRIGFKEI